MQDEPGAGDRFSHKMSLKVSGACKHGEKLGLEQIRALMSASAEVGFEGQQRKEVYGWVERS